VKFVDLPAVFAPHQHVAGLADDTRQAQAKQGLRVTGRDRVLEFLAGKTLAGALDGQPGLVATETHPHRAARVCREVALFVDGRLGTGAPAVTADQELAFYFNSHVSI